MNLEPGKPGITGAGAPQTPSDGIPIASRETRAKGRWSFWRDLVVVVVAAFALAVVLESFVVQVFSIPSGSMENTLLPGDRVLVNKLVYHVRPITRGDIVVFSGQGSWGPDSTASSGNPLLRSFDDARNLIGFSTAGTDYIKRVIGQPGDHVACCDSRGRVTVNGVALSEKSYIHPGDTPSQVSFSMTVPVGRLWVLGDNRLDSDDSRFHSASPGFGTVPENEVVGRAFLIVWPVSRIGDLPIPATFQQAALRAAAAGAAVAAAVPAIGGGAPAAAAAGILAWRRRPGADKARAGRWYRRKWRYAQRDE
jgi:signal peptidase I